MAGWAMLPYTYAYIEDAIERIEFEREDHPGVLYRIVDEMGETIDSDQWPKYYTNATKRILSYGDIAIGQKVRCEDGEGIFKGFDQDGYPLVHVDGFCGASPYDVITIDGQSYSAAIV